MSIRRQDLAVLSFYCLGYSGIRNAMHRLGRNPVARFVTFHDIPPAALENFGTNLRFLKLKTNVISMDEYFAGKLSTEKINVVITFDDGYKSWVTAAVPLLGALDLPATFFISSGFVGLSEGAQQEFMRSRLLIPDPSSATGGLSREDVQTIVRSGFVVGGHTLNHANLSTLLDRSMLQHEIVEDKARLESLTGTRVNYFAFPSGAHLNPGFNLPDLLKEAGYKGAVTTESGFNTSTSGAYLLNRELTGASMQRWVFRARVFGNYDAVRIAKRLARGISSQK